MMDLSNKKMGELDQPDSSVVNLQNVSHNVTEIILRVIIY